MPELQSPAWEIGLPPIGPQLGPQIAFAGAEILKQLSEHGLGNHELADHVDFIGVHLLPYWEGVSVDTAVDYSFAQFRRLRQELCPAIA